MSDLNNETPVSNDGKPWEIYILLIITIGFLVGSIGWEFIKGHN